MNVDVTTGYVSSSSVVSRSHVTFWLAFGKCDLNENEEGLKFSWKFSETNVYRNMKYTSNDKKKYYTWSGHFIENISPPPKIVL